MFAITGRDNTLQVINKVHKSPSAHAETYILYVCTGTVLSSHETVDLFTNP